MGIPSFFNYIIKNHDKIFKNYQNINTIDNVYFDSNSIIYDCIRLNPQRENELLQDYEKRIYFELVKKLDNYLDILKPNKLVILAFDGIPPFAKIEQQRTRRYKSKFIRDIEEEIERNIKINNNNINVNNENNTNIDTNINKFDMASITPGTNFMDKLEEFLIFYYKYKKIEKSYENIIISGPNQKGEGEHKIFNFIQNNKNYHNNTNTVIYGLDADLIMLCLNNLHITKQIHLFREKPSFHTDLDENFEDDELVFLDIKELSIDILKSMIKDNTNILKPISPSQLPLPIPSTYKSPPQLLHKKDDNDISLEKLEDKRKNKKINYSYKTQYQKRHITDTEKYRKIQDFILITFLLGNDFLPHFPALNIRTNGISILLETYKNTIKNTEYISNGEEINWFLFKRLIQEIAKNEENYIIDEYNKLIKQEKHNKKIQYIEKNKYNQFNYQNNQSINIKTQEYLIEQKKKKLLFYPNTERSREKYINPLYKNWKNRYYKSLFDIQITNKNDIQKMELIKKICINYLEGIEWVYKYYQRGCINNIWRYNYSYPPLFSDLVNYIPSFNISFIQETIDMNKEINKYTLLAYVLPENSLHLLPDKIRKYMLKKYSDNYKYNKLCWCFCKYIWESHVEMKHIDLITLDNEIINILQD